MKQHTEDYKLAAVRYYINNEDATYQSTCNIFDCSLRSLKRWVQIYDETENLKRKEREGGAYKVTTEQVRFVKRELKKTPDMFIKDLHIKLTDKFPNNTLNRQYIHEIIRDNNITRKRAVHSHFPVLFRGQPRDKAAEMKRFFDVINEFELKDIISIDETSIKPGMLLGYCRGDLGKRCIIKTDSNEIYKKYSLIVAISNKKCISHKVYDEGAVNADRFEEFLQRVCDRYTNKLFVLDNAQIHKRPNVKKIIRDSGNEVVYTLPYSPRLNPIEQFFNQLKHYMKVERAMNLIELKESVKRALEKVKRSHYQNYFAYMRIIKSN